MNPRIEYAAQTDVGLKRSHNEDAIALCPENGLAILADGMGGYNAGEVASDIAINVIKQVVDEELHGFLSMLIAHKPDDLMDILVHAITAANIAILQSALDNPQYFGMGTTLVTTLCYRTSLVVAHVGDSRGYRLRDGQLIQITHDHSVVQEQIDAGMISAESAQTSDIKNLVTRAVGVAIPVDVEVHHYQLQADDVYLLCSDGLSDMLSTQQLQETLQNAQLSLQEICAELILLANQAGGRDNISVVLFKVAGLKSDV